MSHTDASLPATPLSSGHVIAHRTRPVAVDSYNANNAAFAGASARVLHGNGGRRLSDNLWESDDKAPIYLQQGADLLIGQRAVAGATTVKNWGSGQLGHQPAKHGHPNRSQHNLQRRPACATRQQRQLQLGCHRVGAPDGTLAGGIIEANFNDVIYGTASDETLIGFGGDDALDAGAGDDASEKTPHLIAACVCHSVATAPYDCQNMHHKIDNFDLTAALGTTGYLGIKLDPAKQLALIQGDGTTVGATTTNVWADVNFQASSLVGKQSDITEGTGKSFTLNLNQGAKAGDTLTLGLSGLGDKFKAILGDSVVDANGAVITLAQGQTQVSFALVQQGEVTADASLQLSANYTGATQTATSNTWAINLKDTGPTTSTRNGDQRAKLIGIEIDTQILPGNPLYNTYKWSATNWAADGTLTGGIAELNFSDVIYGTAANDKITGGSANDALSGGDGADEIDGGAGDDLIGGGAGSDNIKGGDGSDYINSSATLNVQQRLSPTDSWSPPGTQVVKTQGALWGIYIDTQSGSPVTIWSGSDSPAGNDGDNVDGGAGNDTIIASGGDALKGAAEKSSRQACQRPSGQQATNPGAQQRRSAQGQGFMKNAMASGAAYAHCLSCSSNGSAQARSAGLAGHKGLGWLMDGAWAGFNAAPEYARA